MLIFVQSEVHAPAPRVLCQALGRFTTWGEAGVRLEAGQRLRRVSSLPWKGVKPRQGAHLVEA